LVLGVVVLDAHAALPEHHHLHGAETLCVASMAIATLAIAAWAVGARAARLGSRRLSAVPIVRRSAPSGRLWMLGRPRAGPARSPILRR
jgi:hypothetical protein